MSHPLGRDLDRMPLIVGEVEVDAVIVLTEAEMDAILAAIEQGTAVEHLERVLHRLRACRRGRLVVVRVPQPRSERPSTYREVFVMPADRNRRKPGPVESYARTLQPRSRDR